ncbi:MAG: hypothetical protein ACU837_10620 [Gammaproteobacteria bacterium]
MTKKIGTALLHLKQTHPKAFFSSLGIIGFAFLFLMMRGNPEIISEPETKQLIPGQVYKLKNPNSFGDSATTELVAVPGTTAAYDTSEENSAIVCHAPNGTRVKIKNFSDAFGKRNLFAEVEVQSGECVGKIGWTMVINIED